MKKLQKKKVTKPSEYKRFLTSMYYHATGEGHIHELRFCYADTKKEAIEKHLDCFGYTEQSARKYFGVGVEVCDFKSEKAKKILRYVFQHSDQIYEMLKRGGMEMQFKLYYNLA
jgi:hypothetical protein